MSIQVNKWVELKSKTVDQLVAQLKAMGLDAEIQAGAGDYSDITTVTVRKDGKAVQFHSQSMYVLIPEIPMVTVFTLKAGKRTHGQYKTREEAEAVSGELQGLGVDSSRLEISQDTAPADLISLL